ncbi:pyridine nucleotide-disulfide oxidoreductase [[Brevibacterium] flavum]|uniref:Pyridine nucleotide-disulfide oxidoreductase n=1 Tax=[Brevibacterium] flavum TaxID=92706 RepID=A0A0F6WRX8_9CORY|nr:MULTISPECIES: FAD-dependent oxidoreductase [Corynebacterium]AKF28811.1 pyridine nucleotide-disulfide oxidoreductase [[Brevibacterium] flavum]ANE09658.1 pyridine nucleotide-disulfide oxidoreductase [Corynebacterium glutamicum]AST22036.1 pyridine nucleotide-disulfide oxidoreductase [Corynebacterium glutamicum ATCC 14067]KEI21653.1 pyridine nucleotide-disulfide oxidoreductase [Corynebacterium glutamicum ATCC 14067]KIH72318.1 pyridine nucleotide-disulfide oxidoreductase [Corynebacterium glutami
MDTEFDLIVVGFGKAGKTIAMKRSAAGDRVALIEQSPQMYGGTCINVGCIPTKKLLFETATGKDFPDAVVARDQLIGKLNAKNLAMATDKGVTVIDGKATLTASHEITVTAGSDTLVLYAPTIVINTGSTPVIPNVPGTDNPHVFDSTGIQHISPLPKHLAIIGGGPIGLEFATLFSGQGSKVTIIDRGELPLKNFDREVAELAKTDLEARGITFLNNAELTGFSGDLTIALQDRDIDADAALIAIGRRPATDGLGLEQAGIKTGTRGEVLVDAHLRTNIDGIFAVGDVNGGPQFTYVSYDDHRIVLDQLAGPGEKSTEHRLIPTTTFIEPPLSTIGDNTEGENVVVKKALIADMPIVPRPKIINQPHGMVKFFVDKQSDALLGATLYCADSQELINTVALAMWHGVTASELGDGIYTHPATSEIFNQLLGS